MRRPIIVLKFGSSVLRSETNLPRAVHEIYRWYRHGHCVVAVVSALAGTTDRLFARAESCLSNADPWSTAALVATGEAYSAALLCLELDRAFAFQLPQVRLIQHPADVLPQRVSFGAGGSRLDHWAENANRRAFQRNRRYAKRAQAFRGGAMLLE